MSLRKCILVTAALALGVAHCGGSSKQSNMPEGSSAGSNEGGEGTPSPGTGPGDSLGASTDTEHAAGSEPAGSQPFEQQPPAGSSAGSVAAALSDPQIATITHGVNTAEIEQARLAQAKSKNQQVLRFAEMMIEHHGQAKTQQEALGLGTEASPLSRQLDRDAKTTLETLQAKTGDDFDRAYLQAQVDGHQQALDAIRELQPNAQNAELRSYLAKLSPQVEQHLEQARAAQQALQAGKTSSR